jgi:hypothetical protein
MGLQFWMGAASVCLMAAIGAYAHGGPPEECARASRISVDDFPHSGAFGNAVAIDGTTVMVGCRSYDLNRGAVFVFKVSGADWKFRQKLTAAVPAIEDFFGGAIAIEGNRAVIGAVNGYLSSGAAHVFEFDGIQWVQRQKLKVGTLPNNAQFGSSVAIENDLIVVGTDPFQASSPLHDSDAYIYRFNGSTWAMQQKLDGASGQDLGRHVAVEGGQVFASSQVGIGSSAVYAYSFNGLTWRQPASLIHSVIDSVSSIHWRSRTIVARLA